MKGYFSFALFLLLFVCQSNTQVFTLPPEFDALSDDSLKTIFNRSRAMHAPELTAMTQIIRASRIEKNEGYGERFVQFGLDAAWNFMDDNIGQRIPPVALQRIPVVSLKGYRS